MYGMVDCIDWCVCVCVCVCVNIGMSINNWPLLPYFEIQFQRQVIVKVISSSYFTFFILFFLLIKCSCICINGGMNTVLLYQYAYMHRFVLFFFFCFFLLFIVR